MKRTIVLLIALTMSVAGMAQLTSVSYNYWLGEGNAAYNEGNYEQALTFYNQVVEAGLESADLYYNMGNTYYKLKQYPMSILYYEKALKLNPGDEDIRANLEIANLAVVDKINVIPQSFIQRWWNGIKASFSTDGWAWVSVVLFALFLFCLFAFLMARRTGLRKVGFFAGLLLLICLVFSVVFAVGNYEDLKYQDEAIVMTPTITVKSSPSDMSVDLFVLHEGAKVRIMESSNGWNKIKIADGSVGWLSEESMIAF